MQNKHKILIKWAAIVLILAAVSAWPVWRHGYSTITAEVNQKYIDAARKLVEAGAKLPSDAGLLCQSDLRQKVIYYNPENWGNPQKVFICTAMLHNSIITCGDGSSEVIADGQGEKLFQTFDMTAREGISRGE